MNKKTLLWVGDAACPSGFAKATHWILDTLREHYEIVVLGINYMGDPHSYPYPIYAAAPGGDGFGVQRIVWMCDRVKPDLIVIQQDGWNIPLYMRMLRAKGANGEYLWPEHAAIPVVGAIAVDGRNFQGAWLDGLSLAIFWTQFALDEARVGGYRGPAVVIPLGVDLETYYPMDPLEARLRRGLPRELDETFIVGCVNRNQPRKRWDLLIKYFSNWVTSYELKNVMLFLHTAPTGDLGCDINQLAAYYGVADRLILAEPPTMYGASEKRMAETYNCFDIAITTTQGEGFGLTTLEAMACGKPCIVPDWSGLGDWAKRGAWLIPCSTNAIQYGMPPTNVIGGVPDERDFVLALNRLYCDIRARKNNAQAALECAQLPRYRWENIGEAWVNALTQVPGIQTSSERIEEHVITAGLGRA